MCISDTCLIELEGMEFHSFHGCLPRERESGNRFIVDLSARCPMGQSAHSDNLDDTCDYSVLYDIVASQMSQASNLLEHVAARIIAAIQSRYPQIQEITVRVSKQNPPVSGPCAWSRVSLSSKQC